MSETVQQQANSQLQNVINDLENNTQVQKLPDYIEIKMEDALSSLQKQNIVLRPKSKLRTVLKVFCPYLWVKAIINIIKMPFTKNNKSEREVFITQN